MSWKSTADQYSRMSIALHWLMVLLFVLIYAAIEFRGIFPKDSDGRNLMKDAHFMLGLTVFVLVWLRLLARTLGAA
ncbi:cytochrome B, partial [Pseudomonas fragi]|nr:cytochrome B [Pseudomonas sp. GC01]